MRDAGAPRLRLFIALPCPLTPPIASALEQLRAAQRAPASGLRVVEAATLHVTLAFLGAVPAAQLAAVQAALQQLHGLRPPTLHVAGAGCFKSALWLGVRPEPALAALAASCESAMRALGLELDARPFIPHVTLARLKARPGFDCQAWTDRHRGTHWMEATAGIVHLYRSDTSPGGARYSILHSVTLASTPRAPDPARVRH